MIRSFFLETTHVAPSRIESQTALILQIDFENISNNRFGNVK